MAKNGKIGKGAGMAYSLFEAVIEIFEAFNRRDIKELRKISNKCTNSLVLAEERGMLGLSVISYALAKMLEKPRYGKSDKWDEFASNTQKKLRECSVYAKEGKTSEFKACVEELEKGMQETEDRDKRYVRDLLYKARIKIASTLYAQGFSLGSAAELTGASERDIASYAGKTMIFDRAGRTKSIGERLEGVRKLFRKKASE